MKRGPKLPTPAEIFRHARLPCERWAKTERCACQECRELDVRWPNDGYQLKLFARGSRSER